MWAAQLAAVFARMSTPVPNAVMATTTSLPLSADLARLGARPAVLLARTAAPAASLATTSTLAISALHAYRLAAPVLPYLFAALA